MVNASTKDSFDDVHELTADGGEPAPYDTEPSAQGAEPVADAEVPQSFSGEPEETRDSQDAEGNEHIRDPPETLIAELHFLQEGESYADYDQRLPDANPAARLKSQAIGFQSVQSGEIPFFELPLGAAQASFEVDENGNITVDVLESDSDSETEPDNAAESKEDVQKPSSDASTSSEPSAATAENPEVVDVRSTDESSNTRATGRNFDCAILSRLRPFLLLSSDQVISHKDCMDCSHLLLASLNQQVLQLIRIADLLF